MSKIGLYTALTKLGLSPDKAKEAATDVANSKDAATKADLKDMLTKTDLANLEIRVIEKVANLEARLTRHMYASVAIIIASIGLMIRFLN
ncbi:MAG: hypothetical protein GDA45_06990 [Chromatiales bacterium]|nr:hypothetical protein [Chromatiales bacterium]